MNHTAASHPIDPAPAVTESGDVPFMRITSDEEGDSVLDRREHRRHDLEMRSLTIERWRGTGRGAELFGTIVDLSAGGVRVRTNARNLRPEQQIRVRLALPDYAGIKPFVDRTGEAPRLNNEWVGWLSVTRVCRVDTRGSEVAGRLVDMDECDRGMLQLYLSTQPLAA